MNTDPVTVEVVRNALTFAAEEMGVALRNSSYSHNIKERMDHSCALFDAGGRLIAQAEHIPVHLGSLPWGVRNTLEYLARERIALEEGDAILLNDPHLAGTHLNDLTLLTPVFVGGRIVAYAANKAHHVDVGGRAPGSITGDAAELFQEGVVVPPVKLLRAGELSRDVLAILCSNVRAPDITLGDLRAQIAANNLGARRVVDLVGRYGLEVLQATWEEIIAHTERLARGDLGRLPNGIYRAEDCLEDIGVRDEPAWIRASITVEKGRVHVDFTGTSAQVEAPLNAVFGVTLSAVYFVIKCILDPSIPMNEGVLRAVTVTAPEGTLVNPQRPAPVAGGNLETSQRIADVLFRALAQAIPDRIPAASNGSMNNVMAGGRDPVRQRSWVYYETIGGGSGGRPGQDGVDGIHCNMTNTLNTPIEAMEQYYPVRFERYEIRPGTGGRGRWRGGCGIERSWTLLGPSATVSILTERTKIPPWGLAGGEPGGLGEHWIRRKDGRWERLPGKGTFTLREGDTLVIRTPGGGGYGDPAQRDPALIERDRANGLMPV
ncbi:MAG: hydantoinase B/oxoprolinase family protein [Armatimonadota bacterium]|nr:hydantoinase B/oxoprolinase family protein [Armatimonadota bacterium]MDR7401269.1 hydantoinase B/oxoprolinase family protein [Armatimonadota bacterium]MDR7402973.1 hydantoinase B/oxoprolinase family protein [Armatimonadota bacterium]MDR7437163.1 hydantoinase B/oxoprolinase family protein [Armatimonadota bacterium]MDR7473212.1 hydantoinase B/oxoprolinase family protein [Armatimonadota bacterium]